MPFERRLAAALLLLIGAVPLLSVYLPEQPEALWTPLLALGCAAVTIMVPSTPTIQHLGGVLGALALVLFDLSATVMTSVGIATVFPLVVMTLHVPAWLGAGLVISSLAVVTTIHGTELLALNVLGFETLADVLGLVLTLGWVLWLALTLVRGAILRRDELEVEHACAELEAGTRRDRHDLAAIVGTLADLGLAPQVTGQGVNGERLNVACKLDDGGGILLASILGEPLATLSVGFAVRAAACAGEHDPAALMAFAQQELDEVNAPEQLEWIGILDEATGKCTTSPAAALAGLPVPFTCFEEAIDSEQTARTVDELLAAPAQSHRTGSPLLAAVFDLVAVVAVPLAYGLAFEASSPWVIPPLLGGFFVHVLTRFRCERTEQRTAAHESRFETLVDNRDDLHHQLARLHGGLLPYQVEVGSILATAHRLRGDVLDGSFADMLALDDRHAKVFAGEIAGEGIAARFLGLAAQAAMRTTVTSKASNDGLYDDVRSVLRATATRLAFPLHLQLGVVDLLPDGKVRGSGSLANMVVVQTAAANAPDLREQAQLDHETHVYLTPAGSRPGPDDTAPVLTAPLAAQRVADTIALGQWKPAQDGLASLFSLVFDGVGAPAHGTLIHLERRDRVA